jgi:Schitoviridae HNH endonuclease
MFKRRHSVLEKIMACVDICDLSGCWVWQGSHSGTGRGGGYPRMKLDGQTVAVHRVSYTHFYGYVPGKKQIDHLCRNRLCVNPHHLEMVTHKENQRRRVKARDEHSGDAHA